MRLAHVGAENNANEFRRRRSTGLRGNVGRDGGCGSNLCANHQPIFRAKEAQSFAAQGAVKMRDARWAMVCALNFFPLAAVLHNAVFFRPSCMLVQFGRYYTDFPTLTAWLSDDPSAPLALVGSLVIYGIGLRQEIVTISGSNFLGVSAIEHLDLGHSVHWSDHLPFISRRQVSDWRNARDVAPFLHIWIGGLYSPVMP